MLYEKKKKILRFYSILYVGSCNNDSVTLEKIWGTSYANDSINCIFYLHLWLFLLLHFGLPEWVLKGGAG